jgi:endo-1,4-beta-mannosidase
VALDRALAAANRHHVRLIIPFVDNWVWWGGIRELAGFRGKSQREFWTDPQVFEDYKAIVSFVVNRVNTVTGVRYRDDKAILAWETGNELGATDEWTGRAAATIKSLDSNHLVLDGATRPTVSEAALKDPNIDLVTTHHYENNAHAMIGNIERNAASPMAKSPISLVNSVSWGPMRCARSWIPRAVKTSPAP